MTFSPYLEIHATQVAFGTTKKEKTAQPRVICHFSSIHKGELERFNVIDTSFVNMQSEEVSQINSALTHCSQLKTQLQGTLLHIQRLNSKYNQTDYMAVIRNLENYRRNSSLTTSPYPKVHQRDCSNDRSDSFRRDRSCTPVKRPNLIRRMQLKKSITSTPKHSNGTRFEDSFDSNQSIDFDTPKRSVREMKTNNNTVSVRTIKVQRNIEAIITHLQVMQRSYQKRQKQQREQSLYQSCCNSSIASPGYMGHSGCGDQSYGSFATAFGSNDSLHEHSLYYTPNKSSRSIQHDQKTLERVQRFYATPLQRMHKRLLHLNASLVSTC